MSNQRFTSEFKDEAVRQVLERSHTIADTAWNNTGCRNRNV